MRTGAAAGHEGYYHEAVYYSSDDELLSVLVPFLSEGSEAGEPTIVALGERNATLVRSALPARSRVEYLTGGAVYARPTAAIRSYRRLLAGHLAAGAPQIRIIGELPASAFGATWDWWTRYESAINHVYNDFPLWSMCAYDRRTTAEDQLAEIARTHPRTACPDGTHPISTAYVEPVTYLSEPRTEAADPLQAAPPLADLPEPTPASARAAIRSANAGAVIGDDDLEDLIVAVSEAVTNALVHGRAPATMRVWAGDGRIVVTITDAGPGPKDPFAGLMPATDRATGGRGLWIVHQSCNYVTAVSSPDGFTLRLTAGNPG
ncbi:anti-sigma factor RsbA family regulatory protein [Actinoplanes sp. NPDC049265]|uniref:anti-sigma factor RsbA family regulatory protein n=1 Tax=Actinoplanes sp. NPDC049265 TaxID=3363902 RepID=UPI003710F9CC